MAASKWSSAFLETAKIYCKRLNRNYFGQKRSFSNTFALKAIDSRFERRVFSGIQPTGVPHIGNYFGAIQHWVALQKRYDSVIFSIVDLHSITMPHNPATLRENILDMTACLLACGIDPEKSIIFQQSSVFQHANLGWLLGCLTTMPKLQHLPQWKEKSNEMKEVPLGIFTYPVLQAADILLYKATDVPVGDDQVKHIELARHLAKTFNTKYGNFFPQPTVITGEFPRIRSLRKPSVKMSKSEENAKSRIELTDSPDVIRNKMKKAVTDFTSYISYDPENRPAVANLIQIHASLTDKSPEEICEESMLLDTLGYKMTVADVLIEKIDPIRKEIIRLKDDPGYIKKVLCDGSQKARAIADTNYDIVMKLTGFV